MIRERIELKSTAELCLMRRAGLVVAQTLTALGDMVAPGITTTELDAAAREILAENGARSSFLDYGAQWGLPPYPAVTCQSINDEIVHGIPGPRELVAGDIISIDFGAIVDGWHGDAARTFLVGEASPARRKLADTARDAMWAGIAAARVGGRVGDISSAVAEAIHAADPSYGIVREYTGHGIGSSMHQPPDVPNFGRPGHGPRIVQGMALAIEPMVLSGREETVTLDDEWTVVTRDHGDAAHWENTITVTARGVWVLTEIDGGESMLASLGVPFGPLAD